MSEESWAPRLSHRLARLQERALDTPGTTQVIGLDVEVDDGEVLMALDPDGRLTIRVPVAENGVEDRRSQTVQVRRVDGGLWLMCAEPARHMLFLRMADDLLERLREGGDAATTPAKALADWRSFLAGAPGQRLTPQALAGLFAELSVVRTMIEAGGSLDWWTGWQGDHVDLRLPGLAVEVKGTLDADHLRVQVHGLSQLADPPDGARLLLSLQRLTHSADGPSVPDLVDDLAAMTSPTEVLERLSEVGYRAEHEADYRPHRFVVEEVSLHEVRHGFPRLTPAHLDGVAEAAVESVDYELNLRAVEVEQHPLELADEFAAMVEGQSS